MGLFKNHNSSIILSDWVMPGMDGLELCQQVRASGSREYTYFILLTSKETKEDYLEAIKDPSG